MRKLVFAALIVAGLLCAQVALAAELLKGGFCQPAPPKEVSIAQEPSIMDPKWQEWKKANEYRGEIVTESYQPKFICDAFKEEVTIQDIYARGWRIVGVLQDIGQDTSEYSARRGLFSGEVQHREQTGIRRNSLIIEEQPKGKK